MLKFISVVYMLCTGHALLCQSANTLISARAQALGYASACLYDEWALFNNVAGIATTRRLSTGFTYEVSPQMHAFNRTAFVATVPTTLGAFGAGLFRFGDNLYNEQIAAAGYANSFGLASLGIKINYVLYHAEGRPNKGVISLSFGGIAKFTEELSVGAHIININQPVISQDGVDKLPTVIQAGFSFKPSPKLSIISEIQKDLEYPATWKGGIEYCPFKRFAFRTGFNTNPDAAFAGLGMELTRFRIDYSICALGIYGIAHQASVTCHFHQRKNI